MSLVFIYSRLLTVSKDHKNGNKDQEELIELCLYMFV